MKKIFLITILCVTLCTPVIVSAQTPPQNQKATPTAQQVKPGALLDPLQRGDYKSYVPLVPGFPTVSVGDEGKSFSGYINFLIKLLIGLTGILAVLMIVIGGIQYVSTDSWNDKDSGKKRIQAALGGLVLALSSYLILNSIDPSLTYLNFVEKIDPVKTGIGGGELTTQSTSGSTGSNSIGTGSINNGDVIMAGIGDKPINEIPENTPNGLVVTPRKVAMDNDGKTPPPFKDKYWQNQTSCTKNGEYLDAGVDRYVVIPVGSPIPCNTQVTVINNSNGIAIQAIVGDRGPGFGEMSRAAAQALRLWEPGMGDEIKERPGGGSWNITYIFQTN